MAITITQQPSSPNGVHTNLMYVVTSNKATDTSTYLYQYVMDVYNGNTLVTRFYQPPNPSGYGVFDVSNILKGYLSIDESWITTDKEEAVNSVKGFTIKFGEKYTNIEGASAKMHTGVGDAEGIPSKTASILTVGNISVDPYENGSFDWSPKTLLTDKPNGAKMGQEDFQTIPIYANGSVSVNVQYKRANGTSAGSNSENVSGGFYSVALGPRNIGATADWHSCEVYVGGSLVRTFYKDDCRGFDRVSFAFTNRYGAWDYFGANLPVEKKSTIKKEEILQSNVLYSGASSNFSPTRRGRKQINVQQDISYTVNSNFLSQEEAEWLQQLFTSENVFVQEGNDFIPVVITNKTITHNTNSMSQKTFSYDIEYAYANDSKRY